MRYVNTTWISLKSLSLCIPVQGTQLLKENGITSLSCITMTTKRTVLYEIMPDVRQGTQNIQKRFQELLKRSLFVVWTRTLPALSPYFFTLLRGDGPSQNNWQSKMHPSVIYQYSCKRFPIFRSFGQRRPECDAMTYHDQPYVWTPYWNWIFIFLSGRKWLSFWRQHMIRNLVRLTYWVSWFAVIRSHHHNHLHHCHHHVSKVSFKLEVCLGFPSSSRFSCVLSSPGLVLESQPLLSIRVHLFQLI